MTHRDARTGLLRRISPLLIGLLVVGSCWLGARGLAAQARSERQTWPTGEGTQWLPPPEAAPIAAMGYRQLWADINWARVLVYFGSNRRESENFRYRYLTQFLDSVIALDPGFERVYEWASYAVLFQGGTVEHDEILMSLRYLEIAMKRFPDRYRYFWLAGIRYFIDLDPEDPEELRRYREHGAMLIEQAMHKPDAPTNIATLAAGLRTKLGQRERALDALRQVILTTDDPKAQAELISTYQQLAGEEFPEEETRAKEEFARGWMEELPFASPDMYVVLGDRPSPVIDFDALVNERDMFGTELASSLIDEDTPADADADADHGAASDEASEAPDSQAEAPPPQAGDASNAAGPAQQ